MPLQGEYTLSSIHSLQDLPEAGWLDLTPFSEQRLNMRSRQPKTHTPLCKEQIKENCFGNFGKAL